MVSKNTSTIEIVLFKNCQVCRLRNTDDPVVADTTESQELLFMQFLFSQFLFPPNILKDFGFCTFSILLTMQTEKIIIKIKLRNDDDSHFSKNSPEYRDYWTGLYDFI